MENSPMMTLDMLLVVGGLVGLFVSLEFIRPLRPTSPF